jgi:hypothetical protein
VCSGDGLAHSVGGVKARIRIMADRAACAPAAVGRGLLRVVSKLRAEKKKRKKEEADVTGSNKHDEPPTQ